MEHLLQRIPDVFVYLDDILVTGQDETSHLRTLGTVLSRLRETGLRVKKNKCLFMVPTVSFLGHTIDADGLHPLNDKVRAIEAAPIPTNVTELKSYLGLLTYYGKSFQTLLHSWNHSTNCSNTVYPGDGPQHKMLRSKSRRNC